jgi:hypothetical protein
MKSLVDNLIWRKYYHCFLGNIMDQQPGGNENCIENNIKEFSSVPVHKT